MHPDAPLTHRQILVVFSGLVASMLLGALDSTIVGTALPTIVGELGGLDRLAWVVTAYLLAQTIVTPLYGKLGDLHGRKPILQGAIVLFLVGSILCGLSANMTQLIAFRFIQGLGGGGLIVTTQAVIADVVPARDRGRYMGIIGAVFGVASIAGPLIGGYFTTHLTWRWIFYVNIPFGGLALAVLAATLPSRSRVTAHRIDYAGAGLLAIVLSGIILATDLGGAAYPWSSPLVLSLVAVTVVALGLFLVVERRAAEPVMPLQLFANRAFTTSVLAGGVAGLALFAGVTYMPAFLQVVLGASPTASGLQMIPMMGGSLVASIVSGQVISRTGRYRKIPIAGSIVMALGLFLLSRLTTNASLGLVSLYMLVVGVGMGMLMQTLVLIVQNAVEHRDVGVATSGATLFRFIGGSVGTAVMGAVFAERFASLLQRWAPGADLAMRGMSLHNLAALPADLRGAYVRAFTSSIGHIYLIGFGVALAGIALTWLIPELPLRRTVAARAADVGDEIGEAMAMPHPDDAASANVVDRASRSGPRRG